MQSSFCRNTLSLECLFFQVFGLNASSLWNTGLLFHMYEVWIRKMYCSMSAPMWSLMQHACCCVFSRSIVLSEQVCRVRGNTIYCSIHVKDECGNVSHVSCPRTVLSLNQNCSRFGCLDPGFRILRNSKSQFSFFEFLKRQATFRTLNFCGLMAWPGFHWSRRRTSCAGVQPDGHVSRTVAMWEVTIATGFDCQLRGHREGQVTIICWEVSCKVPADSPVNDRNLSRMLCEDVPEVCATSGQTLQDVRQAEFDLHEQNESRTSKCLPGWRVPNHQIF